jgi:hypothetical protein
MSRLVRSRAARAAAMAAAATLALAPAAAQNQVGVNAAVRNKVEIRGAGTSRTRPAVVRDRVFLGDEVRTQESSQLQILLLDRTTFTVGAKARVAIDRFVYDPRSNSRSTGISVTRGAFRFMSGRSLGHPSGAASVHTPVASIGVRGTIFEGVVGEEAVKIAKEEPGVGKVKSDDDVASLIVLRGPGPRTQGDTRAGAIDVTAGGRTVAVEGADMAVYVPKAGATPIGPFQISPAGLAAIQRLLRPSPGGGGGGHGARNALIGAGAVAAGVIGVGLLGKKKRKAVPSPNQVQGQKGQNPNSP